jgi:hypothetical protein
MPSLVVTNSALMATSSLCLSGFSIYEIITQAFELFACDSLTDGILTFDQIGGLENRFQSDLATIDVKFWPSLE